MTSYNKLYILGKFSFKNEAFYAISFWQLSYYSHLQFLLRNLIIYITLTKFRSHKSHVTIFVLELL